ncbi:MAG TPA: hypothetical protein VEW42_02675 [Candidatus Eisenbacteria bacterium]|nr:hypothetical protein [Candidatus Eisenbacteria bacterium]
MRRSQVVAPRELRWDEKEAPRKGYNPVLDAPIPNPGHESAGDIHFISSSSVDLGWNGADGGYREQILQLSRA